MIDLWVRWARHAHWRAWSSSTARTCALPAGFDLRSFFLVAGDGWTEAVLPVIARATPVYDSAGQRIGEVEALELDQATSRITRIIVRRGLLFTLANMTREWSAYVLDVAVPYREDPDRVVEIPPPMPRSERGTVARSGDLTPK